MSTSAALQRGQPGRLSGITFSAARPPDLGQVAE